MRMLLFPVMKEIFGFTALFKKKKLSAVQMKYLALKSIYSRNEKKLFVLVLLEGFAKKKKKFAVISKSNNPLPDFARA